MKTFINYFIIIALSMLHFGCSDLIEEPNYTLDPKTVFSDEATVQNALNGVITQMQHTNFGTRYVEMTEMGSGLCFAGKSATLGARIGALDMNQSALYFDAIWNVTYQAISQANYFMRLLEESSVDQEIKDRYTGQAKFLRAFLYFELSNIWGGLPIVTTPTDGIETAYVPRSTRDQVYDQMEQDLLDAMDLLEGYTNTGITQVNEWSARALLTKHYFIRASQEDEGNGTSSIYWQKAKEQGDIVISQGPYSLDQSFTNLWSGDGSSSEIIFKLNFSANGTAPMVNSLSRFFTPPLVDSELITVGRTRVDKALFDSYVEKYPGMTDPRLNASFYHSSYLKWFNNRGEYVETEIYPLVTTNLYPYIKKHWDPNMIGNQSTKDMVLLRYADILLLMAEVENELDNPTQAQTYVNMVLNRARTADGGTSVEPADWPELSKEDFRQEIFYERHYELIGEGTSFIDTRRRGALWFGNLLQRHNDNPNQYHVGTNSDYIHDVSLENMTKNLFWPIPSAEIIYNLQMTDDDQNPGY